MAAYQKKHWRHNSSLLGRYDSEEEYYREDTWHDGHYQNFEVRWTRGPDDYPPDDYRPHRGVRLF